MIGNAYTRANEDDVRALSFMYIAQAGLLRVVRTRAAELAASLLLLVMAVTLVAVTARKSITNDEIVMIPAAYNHVVRGNTDSVREHPPLSKFLAAVPLLFIQPNEVASQETDATVSDEDKWVDQARFWGENPAAFEALSFWPRLPLIALTLTVGVIIFAFARDLFGARAAVLAVALFSLEPTILAHGRVVQTDIPAAFGFLLVFFMLYRYVGDPTFRRAAWLGIAAGLALLSKFSMLLVCPILLLFFLALLWQARQKGQKHVTLFAQAATVVLIATFIINAAYYFHRNGLTNADAVWVKQSFPGSDVAVTRALSALGYLLPVDFVLGVFWQIWHDKGGHSAGLLGMYSRTGWWYYFPVAFALKTSLPFLLLSLGSLAWGVFEWLKKRDKRFLWLLVPFALYTTFVLFSRIDIGVRYYLPAFPFLFILGGALLDRLLNSRWARRASMLVAIALLCWMGVEAARAYPNHMSYMNQLASAHPHWWYLSDSNVEWGDDARELALYLRARGETRVRATFLGHFLTLQHYGVELVDMMGPQENQEPTRYVAVGASFLNGSTVPDELMHVRWSNDAERVNFFDAYRHRAPEAIIGNSIYVYRMHD